MSKEKSVDVRVYGSVTVSVICSECYDDLEITKIKTGGQYYADTITVEVKPHKCGTE